MGRLEQVPDAPGEVALEAADGFFGALALGAFAIVVVLGRWVVADAELGGQIGRAKEAAVESSWPVEVAADAPRVARHGC